MCFQALDIIFLALIVFDRYGADLLHVCRKTHQHVSMARCGVHVRPHRARVDCGRCQAPFKELQEATEALAELPAVAKRPPKCMLEESTPELI